MTTEIRFDKKRPYGKIAPPMTIDGYDLPAMYEQDGRLFDAYGYECKPGASRARDAEADDDTTTDGPMSVDALLRDADTMQYARLLKHAKQILGPTCPNGKQPIIAALREAKAAYEQRQATRRTARPATEAPTPAEAGTPAPVVAGGVDLAAWGRGQKDYLFGEVQKAIRATYHAQLSERRDAVQLLIDQGVITARDARQDV